MSVHDQTPISFDAEFSQNFFAKPGLMDQTEIGIFGFLMSPFVGDQIAFQRRNAVFTKEWGSAAPEVPE